jgi:hypothetical protein
MIHNATTNWEQIGMKLAEHYIVDREHLRYYISENIQDF